LVSSSVLNLKPGEKEEEEEEEEKEEDSQKKSSSKTGDKRKYVIKIG
jgi:hypothetical protein